ncbi:MAG TPA: hypothetical protein PLB34_03790, partial [Rhodoblastus sp.]|nr:hypothetical protein [Rhodoblastus sp.]
GKAFMGSCIVGYNPTTGRLDMSSLNTSLDANKTLVLSNNWMIANQLVLAETKTEIFPTLRDTKLAAGVARDIGLIQLAVPGAAGPRFFLPKEPGKRNKALAILTTRFSVARIDDAPDWSLLAA